MATLDEVSREITSKIDGFSHDLLREIALDYTTNSKKRIFTDGIKADGKQIGWYKASTIAFKRKKGRFTTRTINLRATETLVNSYLQEPKGTDYVVGFVAATRMSEGLGKNAKSKPVTNTELKEMLEKRYGNDLFDPSQEELDKIDVIINSAKFE